MEILIPHDSLLYCSEGIFGADKKKKKRIVGIGLEPSSPTQKARHPSSGDSAKLEWVESSL